MSVPVFDEKFHRLIVQSDMDELDDIPRVPRYLMRRIASKRQRTFILRGHRIDQISFVLFPLAFSVFNALYWTYYLRKRFYADG